MSSALPNRSYMTIGEVLARLHPDFPDVTISKIRFLEAEGLVEPARTQSGYRKFTEYDLERLQYVLAAQRDHYLPLRVIREQLAAVEEGDGVPLVGSAGPPPPDGASLPGPESFVDATRTRFSRDELLEASGLSADDLDTLEGYGLVSVRPGKASYDEDALLVARMAAELAAFGIEARHLRGFGSAADRAVDLVEQVVTPLRRHRGAEDAARADEAARELAALFVRLHAALVKSRLGRR